MTRIRTIGNRIAPARFILFLVVLAVGWFAGVTWLGTERGLLAGFDAAAFLFLASSIPLVTLDAAELRNAAERNDANRWLLLAISFLLTLVILTAITAELESDVPPAAADKLVIVMTLVLVWTFGNAIYALHYAHLYYSRADGGKDSEGLAFPGKGEPAMTDFIYFAFTLGVAVQTADVAITSPHIRKIATIHCIAGFFFNLGVLSLAVNVIGSG
jgi:uncharacterized membrane protein